MGINNPKYRKGNWKALKKRRKALFFNRNNSPWEKTLGSQMVKKI